MEIVEDDSSPNARYVRCSFTRTFPHTLTPKMSKDHEISVYFATKMVLALCHEPPQFRFSKYSGFQLEGINLVPLMPDEKKTFRSSLVLDVRIS